VPFDDPAWGFELKYDGYRLLASIGARARLKTRRGADPTGWFAEVTRSLEQLPGGHVVDGEVAVPDELGEATLRRYRTGRVCGAGARACRTPSTAPSTC
jgi:bifunctional non-homologous end joining protein LigD